jgi:hypothetical protein
MKKIASILAAAALSTAAVFAGCSKSPTTGSGDASNGIPGDDTTLNGHDPVPQDTTPKEGPRLMPSEAYLRTYLQIFGGLSPAEIISSAKKDALLHAWTDYLGLMGLPDYGNDVRRQPQTNTLMLATFERLGVALCDEALLHDWKSSPAVDPADRRVFTFDEPAADITQDAFAKGFDQMHRTFLGYPSKLARTDRVARFYGLYKDVMKAHDPKASPKFTPSEAGWAAVCYGLVRHPELHLY